MYFRCLTVLLLATFTLTASAADKPKTKLKTRRPSTKIPADVNAELDVVYAAYGKRKMHVDVFRPKNANGKLSAIAVEYRLGGEAKFPAGIQDCNAAVRFLRANAKRFHLDPQRIGAVGGSAGGHLVGLMATAPHLKEFQGNGGNADTSSRLQAAIVMAGPLDLASGSVVEKSRRMPDKSNANKWFGKSFDQAPELYKKASPLHHVSKQSPPMLFMVGQHDKPARNAATRKKLKLLHVKTGLKVYANGKHGFWNREPWFTPMVADMDMFFRETLGKRGH